MALNGSGTHVRVMNWATDLINAIPVTAARMDQEHDDISTTLTSMIARDGQSVTTARINFAQGVSAMTGTTSGVSYSHVNDANTGLYFPAADQWGLVAGGTATLTSTTTALSAAVDLGITGALTVSSTVAATGDITHHGEPIVPVGAVMDYAGATAPNGWLLCYGQSLERAAYAALFTAISTTYGAADGAHFNVPDCRGRVVAGQDDMGGTSANRLTDQSGGLDGDTLGDTGGAETHTLTEAQLAAHTHTAVVTDPQHLHGAGVTGFTANVFAIGSGTPAGRSTNSGAAYTWDTAAAATGVTVANSSTGSGTAHNNVQPTIILNKIIYSGVYS